MNMEDRCLFHEPPCDAKRNEVNLQVESLENFLFKVYLLLDYLNCLVNLKGDAHLLHELIHNLSFEIKLLTYILMHSNYYHGIHIPFDGHSTSQIHIYPDLFCPRSFLPQYRIITPALPQFFFSSPIHRNRPRASLHFRSPHSFPLIFLNDLVLFHKLSKGSLHHDDSSCILSKKEDKFACVANQNCICSACNQTKSFLRFKKQKEDNIFSTLFDPICNIVNTSNSTKKKWFESPMDQLKLNPNLSYRQEVRSAANAILKNILSNQSLNRSFCADPPPIDRYFSPLNHSHYAKTYSDKDLRNEEFNKSLLKPKNHKIEVISDVKTKKPGLFISALHLSKSVDQNDKNSDKVTSKNDYLEKGNAHISTGLICETGKNYSEIIGGEIREDIILWVLSMKLKSKNRIHESDICGLTSIKKLIRDKVINPILRPDLHVGLHKAPTGILLFGPPGTGKTTLAKWLSCESGAQFFEVTPSALISKFYGETETLIKSLFKVAEIDSPSVIFIDEIDSLLGKRRDKEEDSTIRMKNQLLQMMDGISNDPSRMVVVVGATNRPDMLDEAALRRLSKRVLVPLPESSARIQQIKKLLDQSGSGGCQLTDHDLDYISAKLEGWNGSDIKALCSKAAEYSYDDAINEFGGIENIPNLTAFRSMNLKDFIDALNHVHPSSAAGFNELNYDLWAKQFGAS